MSKMILAICFSFLTLNALASLPENDLWKEDNLWTRNANLTEKVFNDIISAANSIYEPIAVSQGETFTINRKWTDPTVNANCTRWGGGVTINMFGGLARREEVTPQGFALVLCHEIGHAYGGTPYVAAYQKLSAEGQSDYYGAKTCLKELLPKVGIPVNEDLVTEFMKNVCESEGICIEGLAAGQSLANLLSVLSGESLPDYETPDTKVVTKTQLSYPSTVQCRLDTYFNGTMNKSRPACWFKK